MSSHRRLFPKALSSFIIVLLVLVAFELPSLAAGRSGGAEARALRVYKEAMRLYEATKYREASRRLEAALAIFPHENILYYLAEAYRRVGKLRKAYRTYQRYAKLRPPSEQRRLRAQLHKLRLGTVGLLSFSGTTPGARIVLDGKEVGVVDGKGKLAPIEIAGGNHRLVLLADGCRPQRRPILVEFGEHLRMVVVLRPRSSQPRLEVESVVPGAKVLLDGKGVGVTPFSGTFLPGKHTLRIERPEKKAIVSEVTLAEGKTTRVVIKLGSEGKERVTLVREERIVNRSLLYASATLGGLAAAGLGVAIYYNVRYNNQGVKGSSLQTTAVVAYTVAGVLGAAALTTGLIYILGDPTETKTSRVDLSAAITPSSVSLGLAGRF